MEKSKREHLFELCGGENITSHQQAQINDPETRHVALSDLAKVTRVFLETKAWQDNQYDLELSLFRVRKDFPHHDSMHRFLEGTFPGKHTFTRSGVRAPTSASHLLYYSLSWFFELGIKPVFFFG